MPINSMFPKTYFHVRKWIDSTLDGQKMPINANMLIFKLSCNGMLCNILQSVLYPLTKLNFHVWKSFTSKSAIAHILLHSYTGHVCDRLLCSVVRVLLAILRFRFNILVGSMNAYIQLVSDQTCTDLFEGGAWGCVFTIIWLWVVLNDGLA